MSILAPQGRKPLSADALFGLVRNGFARIPDYRSYEVEIALRDALMAAVAMVSLKAPSLLAYDQQRAEGNLSTIYGIERVPCETHMRAILAPISPQVLRPGVHGHLAPASAGQGPGSDAVSGGPFPLGPGWHRVFFVQDDPLYLVLTSGALQWGHHLYASEVGRRNHPSGPAGRHSADACTDCAARWHGEK